MLTPLGKENTELVPMPSVEAVGDTEPASVVADPCLIPGPGGGMTSIVEPASVVTEAVEISM
jgi:hypothetical protein